MADWNLEDIYSFGETESRVERLRQRVEDFSRKKEVLEDVSAEEFYSILKEYEEIQKEMHKLKGYARLWLSENTSDQKRLAHNNKVSSLLTELNNQLLFFPLWIKNLSEEEVENFLSYEGMGEYEYYIGQLRKQKPYTKTEEVERIISLKNLTGEEAVSNLYSIITNKFLFEWDGEDVPQEKMTSKFKSSSRDERRESYKRVMQKYGENQTVLGEIYKNIVKDWNNESQKIRNYESSIAPRNVSNDIPGEAVELLLKVVRKKSDLFREYFQLKAELLGIEDFQRYDVYAPLGEEKEYGYEKSKKIVLETYKEFSEEMFKGVKKVFEKDHVDSEVREGKRSGAFCYSVSRDTTPYVLLNHDSKTRDLFTMMHEAGHAVHSLLASEQSELVFRPPLPLAETASVFGEMLLSEKLLEEADAEEKQRLLVNFLDNAYSTIVRQAYFVLFEQEIHGRQEEMTLDEVNQKYMENLEEQFKDSLNIPDYFKHEWKYIPHIFYNPFYCYAYAFGNLLVLALYEKYREEGEEFKSEYLEVLRSGGGESPHEVVKKVGLDFTEEEFWLKGFQVIEEKVEELKKTMR